MRAQAPRRVRRCLARLTDAAARRASNSLAAGARIGGSGSGHDVGLPGHHAVRRTWQNRQHPTPYDFQDAAITCLEKDRTPKKRTITHLCQILLGGDSVGTVGYTSLPPLAQNIYDRLAPLGVNLFAKTNQRLGIHNAILPTPEETDQLEVEAVIAAATYIQLFGDGRGGDV